MKFFDEKEDVIDIQLTQRGKRLFSRGEFKPYFYSFFDNDVIYDSLYAGFEENQNESQNRIREVPRKVTQYEFYGIESKIKENGENQDSNNKEYFNNLALGTSDIGSDNYPVFDIKFLNNYLTGTVEYLTGAHQTIKIPQLKTLIEYKTIIERTENNSSIEEDVFNDGTMIKVEDDMILLEISELNTPFQKENFDIEVYKIENEIDNNLSGSFRNREKLIPMIFKKGKEQKDCIENFFDILVDSEIPEEILCKYKKDTKKAGVFSDSLQECELTKRKEKNIYISPIDENIEDCD